MKFVIWGVGVRGKRVYELVGHSNVEAFVDTNRLLTGTKYKGIPIISVDEYLAHFRDFFLILSPQRYEEIIELLEEQKIDNYFKFSYCPPEIVIGQIVKIEEISVPDLDYDKAVIWGSSLYGILLWDILQKRGKRVTLLLEDNKEKWKALLKESHNDVFCRKEYTMSPGAIILQVQREVPGIKWDKVIDLYHLYKFTDQFVHKELCKFKGIHKGQRCFIVGNGSSLTVSDLDSLFANREVCFGVNGIPLMFDKTSWRPYYYVCTDSKIVEHFEQLILHSKLNNIFLADHNENFIRKVEAVCDNVNAFHYYIEDYLPNLPDFSDCIEERCVSGWTVTYACIQIAAYMGFDEIYLLGIDFDYGEGDTVQIKHFDKGYAPKEKDKITAARTKENLLAYKATKVYADGHGIKVYNATRGGKLEVFERVEFDTLF
ncbi:MAG: DUF115 domain-containing protein [Acetatifactor sp.]|nr:DUF115 domain-containing protein [Acetatifactor sp.]